MNNMQIAKSDLRPLVSTLASRLQRHDPAVAAAAMNDFLKQLNRALMAAHNRAGNFCVMAGLLHSVYSMAADEMKDRISLRFDEEQFGQVRENKPKS